MTRLSGLPVHGYQTQSEEAVAVVNSNKELEEQVLRQIDMLVQMSDVEPRWLAIARTDIEKGFMALNRAVFRPRRAVLPEDRR